MGTVNQGSYDNDTGDNSSDEAIGKTIDETAEDLQHLLLIN